MTSISAELKRIERAESKARGYLESGEWRKARRCIRKLSDTFCIFEAGRASLLIHAEIFLRQGQHQELKALLREQLSITWGSMDAWWMLRESNPAVDYLTLRYTMTVCGPNKIMGDYDRLVDFEILANSQEEASEYINEIELFFDEGFSVLNVATTKEHVAMNMKRGILFPSPFYSEDRDEQPVREELH